MEAAAAGAAVRRRRKAVPGPSGPLSAGQRRVARRPARPSRRRLVALLGRAEGVTIAEAVSALGWQPHTVRGAFAGALKKRLGLTVVSAKAEGRGRVYRIVR